MKNIFILFVALLGSDALILNCNYENDGTYGYLCRVQNPELVISKDCRDITGVRGFHLKGKTNDDVKYLILGSGAKILYFPRGATKFFKNIETLYLHNAGLKEIRKEDLREFGEKLRNIFIYVNNDVEVIERDLFKFNRNMETIYLARNKIKHIENGAFDGLQNLQRLELHANSCTSDGDTTTDRSKLMTVIQSVETKCKDPSYLFLEDKNAEIRALKEKIEELEDEIKRLKGIDTSA